jgi:TonB family protein
MRLLASAVAAVLVTLILFYFMQRMISGPIKPLEKPATQSGVALLRVDRVAKTTGSMPGRRLSSPPVIPSTPKMPAQLFTHFNEPELIMPDARIPDLAPVRPGGMPYLGPVVKQIKQLPPSAKALMKSSISSQQPEPAKAIVKQVFDSTTDQAISHNMSSDQMSQTKMATTQAEPVAMAGHGSGITDGLTAGPELAGHPNGVRSGTVNEEVIALLKTTPVYPRKAARSRQEGWVKIEFTITEKGAVTAPKVIASKPRRIFDRAALKAIRNWRFKPKTIAGKAVSRRAVQVIEFKLAAG